MIFRLTTFRNECLLFIEKMQMRRHIDCAVLIASGTGFDQTVFFIRRDVPSLTDP